MADEKSWWETRTLLNVPRWGWAVGLSIGLAVSLAMFRDNLIVALMFAVSIGTAFAIAFSEPKKRAKTTEDNTPNNP